MLEPELQEEIGRVLIKVLGPERVFHTRSDLMPYTADAYIGTMRKGEDAEHFPDFVVLPETTAEVQAVVKLAAKHRIPLIPKGGGSNRTGMLVPYAGGIVVDTIRMDKVLEVSVPDLYVTVQPGIALKVLDEALAPHGLCLNQIQGSYKVATVGGAISTAGFANKYQKYGVIGDRIMSLEVVLADGRVLRTGPKVLYTSTGYRLHQLFVGAEGTLGIVTEATLRVDPLPEASGAIIAYFDDFWGAYDAGKRLTASCVTFASADAFEVPDESVYGIPQGKKGLLIVTFEGTEGEVEAELEHVKRIIIDAGGLLGREEDAKAVIDDFTRRWCGSRAVTGFDDEITAYVPADKLEAFYGRLWNDIMPRYGIEPLPGERLSVDIGRYAMAYAQFSIPEAEDGFERLQRAHREVAELVTGLGGSISACTGSGVKHRDNLSLEFSEMALDTMRQLKEMLDPEGIMNPGKKLPPRSRKE